MIEFMLRLMLPLVLWFGVGWLVGWSVSRYYRRRSWGGTEDDYIETIQEDNLQLRGQTEYHRIRSAIMEACVVELAARKISDTITMRRDIGLPIEESKEIDTFVELNLRDRLNEQDRNALKRRISSYFRAEGSSDD